MFKTREMSVLLMDFVKSSSVLRWGPTSQALSAKEAEDLRDVTST